MNVEQRTALRCFTALCVVAAQDLSYGPAHAADLTRYPRENAAFAGEFLGGYEATHNGSFIMSLQVRVDPTFSPRQKGIIDGAARILLDRALKSHVIDCAYSHAHKDLPSTRREFEVQLYNALGLSYVRDAVMPSFGFIARYSGDAESVGIAYVNLYYDRDNVLPGHDHRHYFHVALNSDFMGSSSGYVYRENEEYWAGVIAHEFLHNLGYTHPTGYPGSFIKEYQRCLQGNGQSQDEPEGVVGDRVVAKD